MSFREFLDMGGYGAFVWSAYGIWLVIMVINYVQPIMKEKKIINDLIKRHKRKQ